MKLGEIAAALGAELEGDAEIEVDGLEPLTTAGPRSLSFVSNPRYAAQLATTRAGALILEPGVVAGPGCAVLRVPNAYLGFALALGLFARPSVPPAGIDLTVRIAPTATIGEGARIAAGVVIGERVRIGARAMIFPHVVVYPEVTIGDDFTAHAGVVIRERVRIGDRVTLASGAVIGSDGFGHLPLPGGGVFKLPQIGTVEIGDDVEVGANTTIDRATIGATRIASRVKLDNLVMIGHGSEVDEESLIAAQTGLAGSTRVGKRVQLGGQVGAAGHLTIGDGARVAAQSGIPNDVAPGATVGGYPALDAGLWRRVSAAVQRLPELIRRVRQLEKASEASATAALDAPARGDARRGASPGRRRNPR
jgi:UDP-3-O-[3-hydroxymyristoyl] glucosamine N-acyltransferase